MQDQPNTGSDGGKAGDSAAGGSGNAVPGRGFADRDKALGHYRLAKRLLNSWLTISLTVAGIGLVVIAAGWLLFPDPEPELLFTIIIVALVALIVFATPQFLKSYCTIVKARYQIGDDE